MIALVNYLLQALRHVFCASGDAVLPLCPQDIVLVKQGLQLFLLPLRFDGFDRMINPEFFLLISSCCMEACSAAFCVISGYSVSNF